MWGAGGAKLTQQIQLRNCLNQHVRSFSPEPSCVLPVPDVSRHACSFVSLPFAWVQGRVPTQMHDFYLKAGSSSSWTEWFKAAAFKPQVVRGRG